MTTPPTNPPPPDDKLPGEAALAALYRQLPQKEPGPALDAAVLRAAAQALEQGASDTTAERRRGPRDSGDWVHPKATSAATLTTIHSIESAARTRRQQLPRQLLALGSAASLVLVAGLAWHMRNTPPAESAPVGRLADNSVDTVAAAKPSPPAPAAAPASTQPTTQSEAQLAGKLAPPAASLSVPARRNDRSSAAGMAAAKAPVPPPALAEAVVAPPMQPPAMLTRDAAEQADQPVAAAAAPAPAPMRAYPAAAPAPSVAAPAELDTAVQPADSPAQALARIEQLLAQGHRDEAQQRLRSFQRVYPQWPLPPPLQAISKAGVEQEK